MGWSGDTLDFRPPKWRSDPTTNEHKAKMAAGRERAKAAAKAEDPRIAELTGKLEAAPAEVARLNEKLSAREVLLVPAPVTMSKEDMEKSKMDPMLIETVTAGVPAGQGGSTSWRVKGRPIHEKVGEKLELETRGKDVTKLDDAPIEGETVNFSGSVEGAEWPPVGEVEAIIEGFVPNPRLVGIRVMGRRASMWRGPRNWRGQEKILVKVDPAHAGAGNPIFLPI